MNTITYNVSRSAKSIAFSNISLCKGLIITLLFLFTTGVFGQTTDTYATTGAGTWTAPCGVTSITVEVWGAGGGGQRANGNPSAGGGGSGGGYVRATYTVIPGTTYNLHVGTGGTGNSGGNGQSSWFVNNTTILAIGGRGAGAAITSNTTWGTGATAYTTGNIGGSIVSTYGGNGGNAGNNFSGGGGSSAGNTTGNNAAGMAGGTAPANGFAGANGRNTNGVGANGNVGSGGAGGRTAQSTDRNGGTGGRGEIRITYTPVFATYCSPTFTTSVEPITNVTFAGINNTTPNTTGGTQYLQSFCDIANVQQGSSYVISLKGNTNGNNTDYYRVYIDWNQNGTFEAGESYNIGTITNSNGNAAATALTGTIAVPAGALLGDTRMRVIKRRSGYPSGPCQTGSGRGQAEDYSVNVTAPTPTITNVNPNNACAGSNTSVTITGTNFINVTGVTINGAAVAAANYSIDSATQITAVLPAGATTGLGSVVVTTTSGSANAAFTVNPSPAISLSSAGTTTNQTVCIDTSITNIVYTVGGAATGASVTGLPMGVSYEVVSGVVTISGTPTQPGTFNYTVTTASAGLCDEATQTGAIIVEADPTITLTSGAISTDQNLCANSLLDTITYTIGGSATGVTVTGLPMGVSYEVVSGVVTISGTPTQFGTFNYTVTTVGGTCTSHVTATGTIVVNNDTTNPVITSCPASTTLNNDPGQCYASWSFAATATDNCGTPTITYSVGGAPITSPHNFPVGTTTVTVTAADNSGNTATCNFTVTVQDNEAPVVICQDITIGLGTGNQIFITPADITGTLSDNCAGIASMTLSQNLFTCAHIGENTVTLTVTDASGNTTSCDAVVTITEAIDASGASVSISANPNPVCDGASFSFTATPHNTGAVNYTWYINGTPRGVTTSNTLLHTDISPALAPGTYEVYVSMLSNLPACVSPVIVSDPINFTVNPRPVVSGPATICMGSTATLSPAASGWSANNSNATVNNAGVITGVSAGTTTFTYTNANGCTNTVNVTINALPVVTAPTAICVNETVALSPAGAGWTSNNPTRASVDPVTGVVTGLTPGNVTFTFTNANGCSRTTANVTVRDIPTINSVTASNNPVCAGNPSILTATVQGVLGNPVTLVNYNFNSGNNYGALDDQNITGITCTVSGGNNNPNANGNGLSFDAPNNSGTITDAQAFTQNNTAGRGLRQQDNQGNNDAGYWEFNMTGAAVLSNYQNFRIYFQARRIVTPNLDKTITVEYRRNNAGVWNNLGELDLFNNNREWQTGLFSLPAGANNPNSLQIRLRVSDGYTGTSTNSNNHPHVIIDNFQIQGATITDTSLYSWTANTGANAGLPANAGTPLNNNDQITVRPEVTTTYTVTVTNAAGCPATQTVTVNVNPTPDIMITADYCPTDNPATPQNEANMVQLTASSTNIPVSNWVWSTGETGNSIYVDIAGYYQVIGTSATGCPGSASISVAQELVVNGDFTQGNIGFDTDYTYRPDINGAQLVPANQGELYNDQVGPGYVNGYSITDNAHNVHINFWGRDHTQNAVGPQNFMVVNGHGTQYVVWKQTVTVEANTTYYFSAWGMSLNNVGPFARLQFRVNGVPHGSILALTSHAENNNQASDNWQRFWGTWDTGAMEGDILIEIINLENSFNGNDFGIDDISFATLSTFINLTSAVGTDNQTVCQNTPITNITYDIGGGLTPPAITGLPAGLTYTYNGLVFTISGTPTEHGTFNYTIETGSDCGEPKTATGTITVEQAPTVVMNAVTSPVCYGDGYVTVSATYGGSATASTWTWNHNGAGSFSNYVTTGSTVTAQYNFSPADTNVTLTFTANAPTGSLCAVASESVTVAIIPYNVANAGSDMNAACGDHTVTLAANNVPGVWTVTAGLAGSWHFSDANAFNSSFTGETGETYTLQWTAFNDAPCGNTTSSVTVTFAPCGNNLVFDGTNDYINCYDNYNVAGNFSLEAWFKADVLSGTQAILSKRNQADMTNGFDLSLIGNRLNFRWNGNNVTATLNLMVNKWYHAAVTFNGTHYKLYIDGFDVATYNNNVQPAANNHRFLIGAMDRANSAPVNYFDGTIDEVRIWNVALSEAQIREMMNQEIQANGTNVRGVVVPLNIAGLQWSNLRGYYQMATGPQAVLAGGTINDVSGNGTSGKMINMTTVQQETAPIPYIANSAAVWDNQNAWQNGAVQKIPNSTVNSINGQAQTWNIVRTQHNVTSGNRSTTLLGLLVDSHRYSINNDQRLDVTKYLKIDGILDLEGESQLLQPDGSYVDYSGTGHLERDQQGTGNKFNYNYWGSPVNNDGAAGVLNSAQNRTFALGSILYDGNNPNNAIAWVTGHSAATTSPLTLSSYWLYLFNNTTGNYSNWISINQNTNVQAGLGYTMKGAGNVGSPDQNYTFKGQPNTGTITRPVSAGNEILVGNPYPSAIDAHTFIDANAGVLEDGAIRYWVQSPGNNSHVLAEYYGGYAYYNKIAGLPAVSPPEIAGVGTANTFIPRRNIPVGQGFFVSGIANGSVQFNNNQRVFEKEIDGNSMFLRSANAAESDSGAEEAQDLIKRIRLDVKSPANSVRHLMLGFTPDNAATDAFDYGYDALNSDDYPNDAAFMIDNDKYVIQGVGAFDITKQYPLGIFLSNTGTIEISLIEQENFDTLVDVFIYDAVLGTYTPINDISFQTQLEAGNYTNRYYVTFQEDETLDVIDNDLKDIKVAFLHATKEIYVKTPYNIQAKQVYLINIIGQTVKSWNATNTTLSNEFKIPVRDVSEGNYILQIETNTGSFSKKIIVKY